MKKIDSFRSLQLFGALRKYGRVGRNLGPTASILYESNYLNLKRVVYRELQKETSIEKLHGEVGARN